jgi:hypothetical protein
MSDPVAEGIDRYTRYYRGLAPSLAARIDRLEEERAGLAGQFGHVPSYIQDRGAEIDRELAELAPQLGDALARADCQEEGVLGFTSRDLSDPDWMGRWGGLYAAAVAEHRTFDLDQLAREA